MPESPDFLHLNSPDSLHPRMQDVMGSTHAETRAESEARKRAESEAEMTRFALTEPPMPAEPPRKSSVLFGVLTVIFLLVALAGTGFGVYEYFENEKLKTAYSLLEQDYQSVKEELTELREQYASSTRTRNSSTNSTSNDSSNTPDSTNASDSKNSADTTNSSNSSSTETNQNR